RAAQLKKRVILVEREKLGGMCLHYGCIPSKTLIHAANFVEEAKEAETIGIMAKAEINVEKLRAWKQRVIDQLCQGIVYM
ncbi:MAG TPA: hypothetical protein VI874_02095, partial [Candidatus Norongarragalinales archaeon]|nr:hypothetical protein [Candidatus Norongarragalinales archaeon]